MVVDTKNSNFIKKASFYIMANKLIDDYYVDYESFVKSVDLIRCAGSSPLSFRESWRPTAR